MDLTPEILGTGVVKRLHERETEAVLWIGKDKLTRGELAAVGCFNFVAALSVAKILDRELQVKDLQDLYDHVAPSALALPRLGVISLAVLGAAFETKGIGGKEPLLAYCRRHQNKVVTFDTLKHQALAHVEHRGNGKRPRPRRRRSA
jgi:hypothetical protein